MKVHLLKEGYTWIQKMRGFTKDPKEDILRNQRFRVREASYPCYYTSKGRDSSYLGLFFTFWAENGSFEFQLDVLCLGEWVRSGEGVVRPGKLGSRFCASLIHLGERFFT